MQELIKIQQIIINGDEESGCDARDLWVKLEIKTKFADWIKDRIKRAQLMQDVDYQCSTDRSEKHQVGRPSEEYYLTLDSAKHIAMLEGTEKGHAIRKYFIEVENSARKFATAINPNEHPLITQARQMMAHTLRYVQIEEEQKRLAMIQKKQADQIGELQAKTSAYLDKTGYYSILAFARINGLQITREQAISMGKKASENSRAKNIPIGQVPDDRWGRINTYHQAILDELFENN